MSGLFGRLAGAVSNLSYGAKDFGPTLPPATPGSTRIGGDNGGTILNSTPQVKPQSTPNTHQNRKRSITATGGRRRSSTILPPLTLPGPEGKHNNDREQKFQTRRLSAELNYASDEEEDEDDSKESTPRDDPASPRSIPHTVADARLWRKWVNQLVFFYEQLASALGLEFSAVCDLHEIGRNWTRFDNVSSLYSTTFDRWILNTTFQSYIIERAWSIVHHEAKGRYEHYMPYLLNNQLMDWFVELCSIVYGDIRVNNLQKTRSIALTRQSQQRASGLIAHLCWEEQRSQMMSPWTEIPWRDRHPRFRAPVSLTRPSIGHQNQHVFMDQNQYALEEYHILLWQALGRINIVRVIDTVAEEHDALIRDQRQRLTLAQSSATTGPIQQQIIDTQNESLETQRGHEATIRRDLSEFTSAENSCLTWLRSQAGNFDITPPASVDAIIGDRMQRVLFVELVALTHIAQKLHVNARYAQSHVLKRITNSREALQFTLLDIYKAGGSVYYYHS